MRVLVIGATGLVGTNTARYVEKRGHDVFETFHTEPDDTDANVDGQLDKEDEEAVVELVSDVEPDAVIDTAAFHDVDACEEERDRAWRVNAQGTRNVALAADEVGAQYVFISTDYVFAGRPEETPYVEEDAVSPVDYYAQTKYAGEQAAKIADDWTVLRPSVIYGLAKPNFVTWALSELRDGESVGIVDDQISTPTYAPDLARACVEVVEDGVTGVYHSAGPESLSRYDFTVELAEVYGYDTDLVDPITTEELGQDAPRPTDGSLDSSRLYDELGWEFSAPKEAFAEMKESEN
ncbi:MAG: dTDP-4-dehydrorhamnose reductase [Halobacteriales archaeon]|nr:dTDP-4-dehydrorhamnose reductase [Halobacteriales archaeon]